MTENFQEPRIIYGTARKEERTKECVREALKAGFRAIDTANQRKHYYEEGVGLALREAYQSGVVAREQIFLQSKFTYQAGQDRRLPYDPNAPLQTQVQQSFESSLRHLETGYLDSFLLHGPLSREGLAPADFEVWAAMEELKRSGRAKAIGVSNVGLEQLKELFERSSEKPAFVQNRCYARTGWDRGVRDFCRQNGIRYQGFSLLTANGEIASCPDFSSLVAAHNCTPPQLVFSFAVQAGMLPLTGTTDPAHMREDLSGLQITLDPAEIEWLENVLRS